MGPKQVWHASAGRRARSVGWLCMGVLGLAACAGGAPERQAPGLQGAGGSTGAGALGASCGLLRKTAACSCDSGLPGRQSCQMSGWSLCECWDPATGDTNLHTASEPEANRRADISFDWERTEPTGGSCEAGHYVGAFAGLYASPAAFNAPVPVASIDLPGLPGLEFWMEEADGSGEHFAISGGKVRGAADLVFPFEIDFTGELDCPSGTASGFLLNGWYEVFGVRFAFEGTWDGEYNRLTHSFVNGTWAVEEPPDPSAPPPDPNFPPPVSGGSGSWNANWDPNG